VGAHWDLFTTFAWIFLCEYWEENMFCGAHLNLAAYQVF
jgi:hypothetical protein